MASYQGIKVENSQDVILLIEACRTGRIPNAGRRLSQHERDNEIRSGAVFIWREGSNIDEVARWTDGRKWEKSRIQGPFLVYNERIMASQFYGPSAPPFDYDSPPQLIKRAVKILLNNQERYHLVAYHYEQDLKNLVAARNDAFLQSIPIPRNLYPKMTRNELYGKPARRRKLAACESFPTASLSSSQMNYQGRLSLLEHPRTVHSSQKVSPVSSPKATSFYVPAIQDKGDSYIHSLEQSLESYLMMLKGGSDDSRQEVTSPSNPSVPRFIDPGPRFPEPLKRTDINFIIN